jgi:hypothetical protein
MKRIKFVAEIAEIRDQEIFAEGTTDRGRTIAKNTGVNTIMCDMFRMDRDGVITANLPTIATLRETVVGTGVIELREKQTARGH